MSKPLRFLWEVLWILFFQISQEQRCQPMALWILQKLHPRGLTRHGSMPGCIAEHGIAKPGTDA
jgi:hypothetical protein